MSRTKEYERLQEARKEMCPEANPNRWSPLYCRYNGFLLGQFVLLGFVERPLYPVRRARIQEFLEEIDSDFVLPETMFELGSPYHRGLVEDIGRVVHGVSPELEDFFSLGMHLMTLGASEHNRIATEHMVLFYANKYGLPDPQLHRFSRRDVAGVNSVSLNYLTEILGTIEKEPQTALVIMPFSEPYTGYYSTFYRPTLERAGFRAFRAWGGLGDEDYIDLLTRLIQKVGLAWADVSKERVPPRLGERNPNVLYEIGAARALGVRVVLVVDWADAGGLPANIGHEDVLEYSPAERNWPDGQIHDFAARLLTEDPTDRTLRRTVRRITMEPMPAWLREEVNRGVASPETADARTALDRDGREVVVGSVVRDSHGTEYEVKDVFDAYPDTKTPSPYARRLFVVDGSGTRRYSLATEFTRIDVKS